MLRSLALQVTRSAVRRLPPEVTMRRLIPSTTALGVALLAGHSSLAIAQAPTPAHPVKTAETKAAKIADAIRAGPASITRHATIKDWPGADGAMAVLRLGTNGWVCVPTPPENSALQPDPMCLDEEWQRWLVAYVTKKPLQVAKTGYAYMLHSHAGASNTDPYATRATPDNQWHIVGPHVMVLYPDAHMYENISDDPHNGGPYVMYRGTPYAHVMWPVH
jgi:hypothetical protein